MEFIKKVLWAGITIAIIYFGYLAYINWWSAGGSFDQKKQAAEQYVAQKKDEVAKQVGAKAQEYTGVVVQQAKTGVLDYVKQKISDGLANVGEGLIHSAESLLGASSTEILRPVTVATVAGNNAGSVSKPTGSGFITPAPPATITTKVGAPIIFSINRGTTYSIDWGDKTSDKGSVDVESVKLVSHAWANGGDFSIKISVRGGGVSQDY
ncbi:MAG: hypothetical protein AAB920_03325, partial [Patescibacteria group bacterium]